MYINSVTPPTFIGGVSIKGVSLTDSSYSSRLAFLVLTKAWFVLTSFVLVAISKFRFCSRRILRRVFVVSCFHCGDISDVISFLIVTQLITACWLCTWPQQTLRVIDSSPLHVFLVCASPVILFSSHDSERATESQRSVAFIHCEAYDHHRQRPKSKENGE